VAAFDPAGRAKDAMTVIDCDPSSPEYGRVVGWSELPTAGDELHHFGWNACSSGSAMRATAARWSGAT
jgi:selenium-binding protein 1